MHSQQVSQIAASATELYKERFAEIEDQLSPCYRTNPSSDESPDEELSEEQRQELLDILDWVEEREERRKAGGASA